MAVKRISPQEARELMDKEGYSYLDVRSTQEFDGGHPAGAYNVPLLQMGPGGMSPNPDFLAVVEQNFSKDAKLVVGCKAGGRSARAVALMEAAGYTNLADQRAGFDGSMDPSGRLAEPGWRPQGLPVSASPEAGRAYAALKDKRR